VSGRSYKPGNMFAHSDPASGSVLNFTMRTSQHVTPLSEHDAPDDMRAALDRVWAMLFVMNGRLTECEAQLREAKGAATGPWGRDDHRAIRAALGANRWEG
jgi:hypothetical protein